MIIQIYDLKTEYLCNPMGIDASNPMLSWKIKSDAKGVIRKSYHIIAISEGRKIWDSGIVASDESQRIRF